MYLLSISPFFATGEEKNNLLFPATDWKVLHQLFSLQAPSKLYTHYLSYRGNLGTYSHQFENRQQGSASKFCVRVIGIAKQNAIIG